MANGDTPETESEDVTNMRVRERLGRTDTEFKGKLPGKHKGRMTPEGVSLIMDALRDEFKFVRR